MTKYLLKASDEAEFKRLYAAKYSSIDLANACWKTLQLAGIAEKPLEPGPYWVKIMQEGESRLAIYQPDKNAEAPWWFPMGDTRADQASIHEIGPRILPPADESLSRAAPSFIAKAEGRES